MFRFFYSFYQWLFWVPFFLLYTTFMGMMVLMFTWFFPRQVNRYIPRWWAKLSFRLTPARVDIEGREHIGDQQSYIIAVNHVSLFDIFVLYGWLPLDLKWVMKKELRKVPVIGISCAVLGHIYIDRKNRKAAITALQAAKQRLRPGSSILFFPEGTRSRSGKLMPFKKGAFVTAKDLDLPVLPVSLIGTDDILPSDTSQLTPGRVKMMIHPPIPASEAQELSAEQLQDRAYKVIAEPLIALGKA